MILPPGTEKSTLVALESLLTTPAPARLPPPPYSHWLANLERTRTGESSRSETSAGVSDGGLTSVGERAGNGEAIGGQGSGGLFDTRRRRRRSFEQQPTSPGVHGLGPPATAVSASYPPSSPSDHSAVPTTSVPFLPNISPGQEQNLGVSPVIAGRSSSSQINLVERGSEDIRSHGVRSKGKVWEGLQLSLGLWEDPDGSGKRRWRRWNRRRWGLFAVIAFLFIGGVIGGTVGGLFAGERMHRRPPPPPHDQFTSGRVIYPWSADDQDTWYPMKSGPPAYDGISSSCNAFTPLASSDPIRSISFTPAGMNQSVSTFFLPMNATEMFIHSMGDSASGSIRVPGQELKALLSEETTDAPDGQVRVDVVMNWKGNSSADGMVCGMTKESGGVGVGVYTPKTCTDPNLIVAPDPNLSFFILVRFPPPSETPVALPLLNITTDQMSLRLGNLTEMVTFDRLEVQSGRGAITSGYTAGRDISLVTSTASIAGTFNTSSSLTLNTTAGGILADVVVWNSLLATGHDDNTSLENASSFFRRSSDNASRRNANYREYTGLSNVTSMDDIPTSQVNVTAHTTSGPLILTYLAQDPGIVLSSMAATTNADIHVSLHSSFQGTFLVNSAIGDMKIPEANDFDATGSTMGGRESDPWDSGRVRAVSYDSEEEDKWAVSVLNATGTDIGYTPQRGNAVYDSASLTWSVQGLTVWLTEDEIISGAANITAEIIALAKHQTNTSSLTGQAAMRQSTSVCATTWGGAKLEW